VRLTLLHLIALTVVSRINYEALHYLMCSSGLLFTSSLLGANISLGTLFLYTSIYNYSSLKLKISHPSDNVTAIQLAFVHPFLQNSGRMSDKIQSLYAFRFSVNSHLSVTNQETYYGEKNVTVGI
jgi:hypothetical protein